MRERSQTLFLFHRHNNERLNFKFFDLEGLFLYMILCSYWFAKKCLYQLITLSNERWRPTTAILFLHIIQNTQLLIFRMGSVSFDISITFLMILLKPLFCPKYEFIHYFGHCHTRRDGAPRRPYCFDNSTKSLNLQLLELIG